MPIVLSDGKIIRLEGPARPAPDCLFEDARESGKAFKLFNRHKENGILAVFNIDKEEKPVSADISAKDMLLEERDYCVYDWFAKKAFLLEKQDSFRITLPCYDEFKFYLFVPIVDGKAVIGLKDKYISVATFETLPDGEIKALDSGEILVFKAEDLQKCGKGTVA